MLFYHGSPVLFDWPTVEALAQNTRNVRYHPLGLWVSDKRCIASCFGPNVYEMEIEGEAREMKGRPLYDFSRLELIRRDFSFVHVNEHFYLVTDLDIIRNFRLSKKDVDTGIEVRI